MEPSNRPVFLLCLYFTVTQTGASSWTINVPSSVQGLPGSCVVIPCSYNYPDPGKTVTRFTGMWTDQTNQLIYHPVGSKVMQPYRNRTELLGDVGQKNCSLKIDPLQPRDGGPFHFRIEITDYDNYSYTRNTVSIAMINDPIPISFSVEEELMEGQTVSASCSVSHSCPTSPPVFAWSHSGKAHFQQQELEDGQWNASSILTFHPASADHNRSLQCTVRYKGGQHHRTMKVLQVKHAPVNVKVDYKSDVKEGESVRLKCSSEAHPAADSYEWHDETGAKLHQGETFMLKNVSRHNTGAVYCAAINTVGRRKSNPVRLSVLYAPEVQPLSSCSSNGNLIKCVCIVESKPPSTVHFVLSDRVLPSTSVERNNSSVTIGTLQAELGSSEFAVCLANNTQGNANVTLFLTIHGKMESLYIIIAIAATVLLVILLIAVVAIKKCRGRSTAAVTPHMRASKDVVLPRKVGYDDDISCPSIYANEHIYGNMETCSDDAIYANV